VSVMRDLARALASYGRYDSLEIDIFAAVDSHDEAEELFKFPSHRDKAGKIVHIPGLAYHDAPYPDKESFTTAARTLASQILESIHLEKNDARFPYILHAHNISLGKNPLATLAFWTIADIARQENLPLWLINQVHDFAENNRPDRMEAFYTCTGTYDEAFARHLMYRDAANVLYLTINRVDIETLRMLGIHPGRIFLLPDPIDIEKLTQKALWEEEEWKREGLPSGDYKEAFAHALQDVASSTSQIFDPSLPALLSPVKVMRRKNVLESILLITLFQRMGSRFQLLVSLEANSSPDIKYANRLKQFVSEHSLPVLVGFGNRLVTGGKQRVIRDQKPELFSLSDMIAFSKAVLTTSVMEGFGFVYHEGWLCGRPVIGRKIPEIVSDFEANGMNFNHMYDRLVVPLSDFPDFEKRLNAAYKRQVRIKITQEGKKLTLPPIQDIINAKILDTGGEKGVDFADLDVEMQLEVIEGCLASSQLADKLIDRNPVFSLMIGVIDESANDLIERNRVAVKAHYSLEATARRLEHLFEIGDSKYQGIVQPEDHAAVLHKYHNPDRIRLLLEPNRMG